MRRHGMAGVRSRRGGGAGQGGAVHAVRRRMTRLSTLVPSSLRVRLFAVGALLLIATAAVLTLV
jgi:hypothetical protein